MAQRKLYTRENDEYERKLARVMERLGIKPDHFSFDYGRWDAWVQFIYANQQWRLESSVQKAQTRGQKIHYGSDCFAQLVLTLEDIARAVERGLYKLGAFLGEELKYLPPPPQVPDCLLRLGFDRVPDSAEAVHKAYRALSKVKHPDAGGTQEDFQRLVEAHQQAIRFLETSEVQS